MDSLNVFPTIPIFTNTVMLTCCYYFCAQQYGMAIMSLHVHCVLANVGRLHSELILRLEVDRMLMSSISHS